MLVMRRDAHSYGPLFESLIFPISVKDSPFGLGLESFPSCLILGIWMDLFKKWSLNDFDLYLRVRDVYHNEVCC